jgi:hypothetical protein
MLMARYRIDDEDASVSIEVTDVAGQEQELLEAFGECQAGQCSCPTDEYQKLASMDVQHTGDVIRIRLEPTAGQVLNTPDRCVPRLHHGNGERRHGRRAARAEGRKLTQSRS